MRPPADPTETHGTLVARAGRRVAQVRAGPPADRNGAGRPIRNRRRCVPRCGRSAGSSPWSGLATGPVERAVETTGGHRRVDDGRTSTGRRAKAEEPSRWNDDDVETTGAHTAGRSVTEIIAAHANQDDAQRRHRRRAD